MGEEIQKLRPVPLGKTSVTVPTCSMMPVNMGEGEFGGNFGEKGMKSCFRFDGIEGVIIFAIPNYQRGY